MGRLAIDSAGSGALKRAVCSKGPSALKLCALAFLFAVSPGAFAAEGGLPPYSGIRQMPPVDADYDITSERGINKFPDLDMSKTGPVPKYVEGKLSKDPRIDFDRIAFIKRRPYKASHYYTFFLDGIRHTDPEGGALCVLDLKTGKVRDLVPEFSGGTFQNIDVSFDAKKIVFSYKKPGWSNPYLLYEVGVDGSDLRQLTRPADDNAEIVKKYGANYRTCDMDPCYAPDGSIIFSSTRARRMTLCDNSNGLMGTSLYKLLPDGKIERLTESALSEFNPVAMSDGRIMYHRWEYVDKGNGNPKCLWSMRPDGSGTAEIYGNDIVAQRTIGRGVQVPGKPNKILALVTAHVNFRDTGTLVMIDTNKNMRTPEAMTFLTPYTDARYHWAIRYYDAKSGKWEAFSLNGKGTTDERTKSVALYKDPYPIAEDLFLVSFNAGRNVGQPDAYGIYLLNDRGEHELVYRDRELSSWCAYPLKPRPVPPLVSGAYDESLKAKKLALVTVQDVYEGLKGVPRKTVKWIRIMEQPARFLQMRDTSRKDYFRHSHITPAPHLLSPRHSYGIVPVDEDGSAKFFVPADKNIYFQLLDENLMMVQTERTYINYKPGEMRSCIGCHENSSLAPTRRAALPSAHKRAPSVAVAQPNWDSPERVFDYEAQVQPILDKYCVSCHSGNPSAPRPKRFKQWGEGKFYTPRGKGEPLDLRGEHTEFYSASYEDLFEYVRWPNENEVTAAGEYAESYQFGAHRSGLIERIIKGCPGQKEFMSRNEFATIVDWLDTGANYHPSYWGRKSLSAKGKPDYRPHYTLSQIREKTKPYDAALSE